MIIWIVLSVYILFMLLVGIFTRRKVKTEEGYFLGGRTIGPWVTALSYISAYFSSVVIIGGGGFGYRFGMATVWVGAINVLFGCLLAWIVLSAPIRQKTQQLGTYTVPGFISRRFDSKYLGIISALVISIFLIVYNVSVLKGMGHLFEVLLTMPYESGVLISGVLIILYVALGGYLAVVWTGFFQALIMIVGLVILTLASLNHMGGLTAVHSKLASIDPQLITTPGRWGFGGLLSFSLVVSFGVWGMPQLVARFYSIKDVRVLKTGTLIATIGGTVAILPYLNGAIARIIFPSLPSPDLAIPNLTNTLLSPLGRGIFMAAVIAAGMSTFSAVLIIISGSAVKDLLPKITNIKLTQKDTVRLGIITSVIVGIISLLIALKPPGLILTLTAFAWAVIASTVLWPIFFAARTNLKRKKPVLISMVVGLSVSLIWMVFGSPFGIHGFIPGIISGFLAIILF